jgi:hypothetical protein
MTKTQEQDADARMITSGAERMRRSRQRRQRGGVIVSLEIGSDQISQLIALGWVTAPDCVGKDALTNAVADFIARGIAMRITRSSLPTLVERDDAWSLGFGPVDPVEISDSTAEIVEEKPQGTQPSYAIDPVRLWGPRLELYQRRQMWLPAWGPRPDQVGCAAPGQLLEAHGIRTPGLA